MSWRELSEADREREYSPSSCVPNGDYRPFVEAYHLESERSRAKLVESPEVELHVLAYGDSPTQSIDVAVPTSLDGLAPLLVFIHGGYWQELSKDVSFFPAWDAVERGWAYAAVDYTLAPVVTIDEIVVECQAALRTLRAHTTSLGIDERRIVISGSSAGAHLAAMVAHDAHDDQPPLAGLALVSGIYELEPLIGTSVNQALGLDIESAKRNSPRLQESHGFPPTILVYGDNETTQFKRQSAAFAEHLRSARVHVRVDEIPERNHFDVVMELAEPGTRLGDAVAELIEASG